VAGVQITDLGRGVHRVTHPLPFALNHVHCYAVEGADGWALVDTGLGPGGEERWRDALEQLGAPHVRSIVLTHFHPDHVGASAALQRLTGAEEVLQGRKDAGLAQRMYNDPRDLPELGVFLAAHGMPAERVAESVEHERELLVSPAVPTRLLDEGDTVQLGGDEFAVLVLPGHADGHVALYEERSGRLFAGDTILNGITPNVSTWHLTEPDPLARYLVTLARIAELRPTLAYTGHHRPIDDVAGRALEISDHHRARLDEHEAALRAGAVTSYEVSQRIWGNKLTVHELRFALGEAISHLTRLAALGRATETAAGHWQAA
jgi:glyoxylase-like metal-dependent hydrolase (beta-lactamase superfamily II)